MTQIWRINIKTEPEEGIDPRNFCIDKSILGIGWAVEVDVKDSDWDTYYKLAEEAYYNRSKDKGWWPAINAIKNRMQVNDLCWTRDKDGIYYLGRIRSDWRYEGSRDNRAADVVNIRDCDWKKVGTVDAVPGKVVSSFIPRRTVQAVYDETVKIYSEFRYNSFSEKFKYPIPTLSPELFSLISAEDCEDIVGLYLQERGYRIIPSSCKSDTLKYEFVMKHTQSKKNAVVQVKIGDEVLHIDEFKSIGYEVYLFATSGKYVGNQINNIHCITPETIKDFIKKNVNLLPEKIQIWLDMCKKMGENIS